MKQGAVILVHYGDPATTRRCIESIWRHEGGDARVYVADHGPGLPLEEALGDLKQAGPVTFLRRANDGFGAGCNAAAARAFQEGAPGVWFLNNDATLAQPVLTQLLLLAQRHPEVGLWGTLQRSGTRVFDADALPGWFPTPASTTHPVEGLDAGCAQLGPRQTLSGASIFITTKAWEALGPWPEWNFLYWEDVAWCLEAHRKGIPVVMAPLEVLHVRNTTTGFHSPVTTYYGVRNGLLLHEKLWPSLRGQRLTHGLHLLQKRFFQGNWRMLGPTLRAIRDARKGLRGKQDYQ